MGNDQLLIIVSLPKFVSAWHRLQMQPHAIGKSVVLRQILPVQGRNCVFRDPAGDSRAVLSRAGLAFPLTDDHKAAREDETVRLDIRAEGQVAQHADAPEAFMSEKACL